jgi:hypothetical protein
MKKTIVRLILAALLAAFASIPVAANGPNPTPMPPVPCMTCAR